MFPIYKRRDDGYYRIDLRAVGQGQISLRTKDRKIAQAKAREIELTIHTYRPQMNISFDNFVTEYISHAESTKAPNTKEKEYYALKLFQKVCPVNNLQEVTPRLADRFIQKLSSESFEYKRRTGEKYVKIDGKKVLSPTITVSRKLSRASVNSYLSAIRSVFSTALRWGYISENPFKDAKEIPEDDQPARVLTLDELQKIFIQSQSSKPFIVPLLEFYLLTGTRRSEALNLEWSNVDFNGNLITLFSTKGKTKWKKKSRTILMRPRVKEILMQRTELEKPFPYRPRMITENFRMIARQIGIKATIHSIRSTFSSYIQQAGMPIGFVSWYIGHADEEITKKEYTGFYGDMVKAYFDKYETQLLPILHRRTI